MAQFRQCDKSVAILSLNLDCSGVMEGWEMMVDNQFIEALMNM